MPTAICRRIKQIDIKVKTVCYDLFANGTRALRREILLLLYGKAIVILSLKAVNLKEEIRFDVLLFGDISLDILIGREY